MIDLSRLFGPLGYRGVSQPHRQSIRKNPHRGSRRGGSQRMRVAKFLSRPVKLRLTWVGPKRNRNSRRKRRDRWYAAHPIER